MLREFIAWYSSTHGEERMRLLAKQLPEDLRSYVDPDQPLVSVLAASWYPARLTHFILDAVTEGMTESEILKLAHDSNRAIVEQGMSSVYRFALDKLVTPEMYAVSIPRLWRQLHNTGEREIKVTSKNGATSIVRKWPGHHPVLCTIAIETMCAVFETMGKKEVRWSRTSCVSRGGTECVTLLQWK